jgi:uncharacterized membrane protein
LNGLFSNQVDMTARRSQVLRWVEAGVIGPGQVGRALELTGLTPDAAQWRQFIDRLMLIIGVLALACSAVFLIAYNWDAMGRYVQFVLAQAAMLVAVLLFWWLGTEKISARMALLAATILLGALLALYGQTYQTGADPWQLFATWALLMLPWALLGRLAALWLLWLGLLNLTLILYFSLFRSLLWLTFGAQDNLFWLLFLFNSAAWLTWELAARHFEWLAERWAVRLLSIGSGLAITMLVLRAIFDPDDGSLMAWPVWMGWLAALYFVYRRTLPDLFMLAGACLSIIVCLTSLLAHFMLRWEFGAGVFLLLAFLVVGQAAVAATWLKGVHSEQGR